MAYCTIEDMIIHIDEEALIGLATKRADAKLLDDDVLAKCNGAIEAADGKIDSFLLGRFGAQLRTGDTAKIIKHVSAQLAVHKMYKRRGRVDEDWEEFYEDVMEWLKWLGEGRGEITADTATGAAIVEPQHKYQTDAEVNTDAALDDNDRRNYTPSKQVNLWGVK